MSAIIATNRQYNQNKEKGKCHNEVPNITEFINQFCRIIWTVWKIVDFI